jgi:hypothetical protein
VKITTGDIVEAIQRDAAEASALAEMVDELAAYMVTLADVVANVSGPGRSLGEGGRTRVDKAVALLGQLGYDPRRATHALALRAEAVKA